jgi:hypothetical protein
VDADSLFARISRADIASRIATGSASRPDECYRFGLNRPSRRPRESGDPAVSDVRWPLGPCFRRDDERSVSIRGDTAPGGRRDFGHVADDQYANCTPNKSWIAYRTMLLSLGALYPYQKYLSR